MGEMDETVRLKMHKDMLRELQSLSSAIPSDYREKCNLVFLTAFSESLLDGTVFEIAKDLKDIQLMTERNLFAARAKLVHIQKARKAEVIKCQRQNTKGQARNDPENSLALQRQLREFEALCEHQMSKHDESIVYQIDELVQQQQLTLEKAGVPGFHPSSDPLVTRFQMYLLEFIIELHKRFASSQPKIDQSHSNQSINGNRQSVMDQSRTFTGSTAGLWKSIKTEPASDDYMSNSTQFSVNCIKTEVEDESDLLN